MTSNNLLEVFGTFECYHWCAFKYSVEFGVYLQDISVSIHNFRYVRECPSLFGMFVYSDFTSLYTLHFKINTFDARRCLSCQYPISEIAREYFS